MIGKLMVCCYKKKAINLIKTNLEQRKQVLKVRIFIKKRLSTGYIKVEERNTDIIEKSVDVSKIKLKNSTD